MNHVHPKRPRRIYCLAFPDCQVLDVTGPMEVFAKAEQAVPGSYALTLLAREAEPIRTSGAIALLPDRAFSTLEDEELAETDTLLVAGGRGAWRPPFDPELLAFLRRAGPAARRCVSICSGAYLLAAAGLLEGRRATTHWDALDDFAARFPEIDLDRDAIYVQDGPVWTSAGVTAGIDLALALVEEDLGREVALGIARDLVVYMMRPGGQAQFSAQLRLQHKAGGRLGSLLEWIDENAERDLSVPVLADRCAMSARTFTRRFAAETGTTPARFVELARIDRARRLLEQGDQGLERIAADCGLRSAEVLRRLFQRHLGISPSQYRERFTTTVRPPRTGVRPS